MQLSGTFCKQWSQLIYSIPINYYYYIVLLMLVWFIKKINMSIYLYKTFVKYILGYIHIMVNICYQMYIYIYILLKSYKKMFDNVEVYKIKKNYLFSDKENMCIII